MPETISFIGKWAFSNCTILESITIPHSISYIGSHAFSGCSSMNTLYLQIDSLGGIKIEDDAFEDDILYNCTLIVSSRFWFYDLHPVLKKFKHVKIEK